MLKIDGLGCGYDNRRIITGLSLSLSAGEKLCVLGANGSGKTTLLKAITGLIDYEGSVKIDGLEMKNCAPRQRAQKVGLMSQFSWVAFDYTVYECVSMGRYARKKRGLGNTNSEEDKEAVDESLKLCGVYNLSRRYITELSGGQLQRVFLARLFCQDPMVILLDEPLNHLDLAAQKMLIEAADEWVKYKRRCIVGVFHDINTALNFADRILLLEEGRVKTCCKAGDLDLSLLNEIYGLDVREYMRSALDIWR